MISDSNIDCSLGINRRYHGEPLLATMAATAEAMFLAWPQCIILLSTVYMFVYKPNNVLLVARNVHYQQCTNQPI